MCKVFAAVFLFFLFSPLLEAGWRASSLGPINGWTAPLCGEGEFSVQPFLFFSFARGSFDGEGDYLSLPSGDYSRSAVYQVFAQKGLKKGWEVAAQSAYVRNRVRISGKEASAGGVSDSYLFVRKRISGGKNGGPEVSALFQLKIPTGKYQNLKTSKLGTDETGNGSFDHAWGIILSGYSRPFAFHFDAIAGFPFETKIDSVETDLGNYLNADLAAEYFISGKWSVLLEVNSYFSGNKRVSGKTMAGTGEKYLSLSPGLEYTDECFQAALAYERIVSGENTEAVDILAFSAVFPF